MLPTKNYKRAFEFVEVIIRNIVIFFQLKYSKNGIFDDVTITSALHSDRPIAMLLKLIFSTTYPKIIFKKYV